MPVLRPFPHARSAWPNSIVFRHQTVSSYAATGEMNPRSECYGSSTASSQPESAPNPAIPLQFGHVIERVHSVEFTGIDETHEQIADLCSVERL